MASQTLTSSGTRSLDDIRVEEAMHHGVLTCALEARLGDVAALMADNNIHCVVGLGDVTEADTRLWGMISDHDLVAAAATEDVSRRTAGDTAGTDVITIAPEASVRTAAELMTTNRVTHLLVVEAGSDLPLGVISALDVARAVAGRIESSLDLPAERVEQLMTSTVVTVAPDLPLPEVAALLVRHRISGVPVVVDEEVVGVVSEADILAKERGEQTREEDRFLAWLLRHDTDKLREKMAARTAGEAMSTPAITIDFWRSPSSAAALMLARGVKRLPVTQHGRLVGIVTRGDLVRAFARSDEAIAEDIRTGVILHAFWMTPNDVDVAVEGGEVTLRGVVESEAVRHALVGAVRRVAGVVAVIPELTLRPDARTTTYHWLGERREPQ
jgi:CBS domain-containing protein